mmetsp:Transcript_23203/g.51103  ORF Transcript_23203/g.51103 Transcript_23203/m.51103 type:complete len:115 (-) Transcript_23203:77-421(-)|eukprot:CAMPEP_0204266968 /NCGR_PEP_ID=MMETSP0468-20130131/10661_1 /ASSEMBLY_ACC=CAM_ASM_000383 /TAXON_ID=2969 /ORGANISM="Oxyrrhis marina" /LENGTH=114 /DNA_ID=CAMNT_0051242097 /DNA_START=20 /DNA_END=364 /DNA_ORIENTATION=-
MSSDKPTSSGNYGAVMKGSLKLKGGASVKKKKKKREEEQAMMHIEQPEVPQAYDEDHGIPKTLAERKFEVAKAQREAEALGRELKLTHREKMERFNEHLSKLSEHFDIPKVGPG